MRKAMFALFLFSGLLLSAQPDSGLNNRLHTYMQLTRELKFEQLMDYVHPSLYKVAPKEQLAQMFRAAFDNEEMQVRVDSTAILAISPVYKSAGSQYRKIDYYMQLSIWFKDTAAGNEFVQTTTTALQAAFPHGAVAYNQNKKAFVVTAGNRMVAIKDAGIIQWMFLGVEKTQASVLKALFPPDVINHFKLF